MGHCPKPISVEFGETTPLGRREMGPPKMKPLFSLRCYTFREHDPPRGHTNGHTAHCDLASARWLPKDLPNYL